MASRKPINQNLYQSSLEGLVDLGVPEHLAKQASEIAATDDWEAPDLGRTDEQKQIVREAMGWMKIWGNSEGRK